MVTKYIEKVKIYNHYTNYKGRLFIKTLCDLFNDVAEEQTVIYGVDVDTMNKQGMTWMLHRLHIQLHKMPQHSEEVVIETWPSGIDRLFALRDYRMLRKDGEVLVLATSEWMSIDLNRRRPTRLSEKVIDVLIFGTQLAVWKDADLDSSVCPFLHLVCKFRHRNMYRMGFAEAVSQSKHHGIFR